MVRYNKVLVADQVRTKLTDKCVSALITEAFVRALPFTQDEVALEAADLGKYSANVLKMMKPGMMLKGALESTTLGVKAKAYVKNFNEIVEDIVEEATCAIMKEAATSDDTAEDICKNADFSKVDKDKLINASKKAGISEVAELVKKKVIDTIKDEKEAYEESQKIRDDIHEVLKKDSANSEETDSDASAIESYLDLVLTPSEPRHHVSFFSKLQDVCIENLMYSNEIHNTEIPYQTLTKITLESTLPYFDLSKRTLEEELASMALATESMIAIESEEGENPEEEKKHKMKKVAKTAFICSICIMTLLEVLKSMNMRSPSLGDVKNFVDAPTDLKKPGLSKIETLVNSSAEMVKKSAAMGSMNAVEAESAKTSLMNLKNAVESLQVSNEDSITKTRILDKLASAIECATTADVNPAAHQFAQNPSMFTNRAKEANIVEIEHAISIMNHKPLVRTIEFRIPAEKKSGGKESFNVVGKDDAGNTIASYMVTIDALTDFGETVVQCVKECAQYAQLGDKPVTIYFTDSCYSVSMK